ncbi:hypothetical protein [Salmonella enterica]|uniref:Uncharacterized protein n=1 Tax=Salmonella enterica subsp. enterica serovar Dessau TaxID=2564349 RepID=A0A8E5IMR2_SALET|nr:hypothetical protein [Salmonella enterica]QUS47075.1 hypothetical protein F1331_25775 [Salmonella enterica subsp. enterica serovar Dessau]
MEEWIDLRADHRHLAPIILSFAGLLCEDPGRIASGASIRTNSETRVQAGGERGAGLKRAQSGNLVQLVELGGKHGGGIASRLPSDN